MHYATPKSAFFLHFFGTVLKALKMHLFKKKKALILLEKWPETNKFLYTLCVMWKIITKIQEKRIISFFIALDTGIFWVHIQMTSLRFANSFLQLLIEVLSWIKNEEFERMFWYCISMPPSKSCLTEHLCNYLK